jgi:hypothetical protein
MMNSDRAILLTAHEQLDETVDVLAIRLMRLRPRKSSQKFADFPESSLAIGAAEGSCRRRQTGRAMTEPAQGAREGPRDPAIMRLVRALARDAARQDHERQTQSNEARGNIRPVLDRLTRR